MALHLIKVVIFKRKCLVRKSPHGERRGLNVSKVSPIRLDLEVEIGNIFLVTCDCSSTRITQVCDDSMIKMGMWWVATVSGSSLDARASPERKVHRNGTSTSLERATPSSYEKPTPSAVSHTCPIQYRSQWSMRYTPKTYNERPP